MRIESSDLALRAQHRLDRTEATQLRVTRQVTPPSPPPKGFPSGPEALPPGLRGAAQQATLDAENSLRLGILNALLKQLLGEKFQVRTLHELTVVPDANPQTPTAPPAPRSRYAIEITATRFERETLQFHAAGRVVTGDGREIALNVQLNMSRTAFARVEGFMGDAPEVRDPLMLNLDGGAPSLSATRFEFDLDADGQPEPIPVPDRGTAFLAHDRNGDGRVNDGRELFGARSGDGFGELARHDGDRNGWIDEADAVFRELRIWQVAADGRANLVALGELGIGAVFLGNVASPFQLLDDGGAVLGLMRESSVYLRENGTAGSVHQVDMVV